MLREFERAELLKYRLFAAFGAHVRRADLSDLRCKCTNVRFSEPFDKRSFWETSVEVRYDALGVLRGQL